MKDQYNAEIAKMGQAYSKLEQYIQRIDVLKGQYVESLGRERLQKATALKLQNQLSAQKDYHELKIKAQELEILKDQMNE